MISKKALYAITILLSSQTVFCMDYHDLYQDTGFFENIRTQILQNDKDPFYLGSVDSTSSSENSSLEPQPGEKRKATTIKQKAKRRKTVFKARCIFPECSQIFIRKNKSQLVSNLLMHIHSKTHDKEKYNELKEYAKDNAKIVKEMWQITCMRENCQYTLSNVNYHALPAMLMQHLYASNDHNKVEIEEVQKYIEEQLKK